MTKRTKTPLRIWLDETGETISGMARVLDVSRGRAQHWVIGRVMPRGHALHHLMQLTKLSVPDLMPKPAFAKARRRKERERKANGKSR